MQWTNILLAFWGLVSGLLLFAWLNARHEVSQWRKLENSQARRLQDLQAELTEIKISARRLDEFRRQPGMETVSYAIASKFLDLQAENLKVTSELNEMRLQAAKYMDLYRQERYKPRQVHR